MVSCAIVSHFCEEMLSVVNEHKAWLLCQLARIRLSKKIVRERCKRLSLAILVLSLLPSCKLIVKAPVGGWINGMSGQCASGCEIDVSNGFWDFLSASPKPGYRFVGWQGYSPCGEDTLCLIDIRKTPDVLQDYNFNIELEAVFELDDSRVGMHQWGEDDSNHANVVKRGHDGNILVAGSSYDNYLRKALSFIDTFDASNNLISSQRIDSLDENSGIVDFAVDPSGNRYLLGGSRHDDWGYAVQVVKVNSTGNILWEKEYGPGYPSAIAMDRSGDVIIAAAPIVRHLETITEGYDAELLLKIGSDGSIIWQHYHESEHTEKIWDLVIDDDGNIFTVGIVAESSHFRDILIEKFSSQGNSLWYKVIEDIGDDVAYAIVLDNKQNLYITGNTQSESFQGGVLENWTYAYTMKLSNDGDMLWATIINPYEIQRGDGDLGITALTGQVDVYSSGLAVDEDNNAYIAGSLLIRRYGEQDRNAFAAKIDSDGNIVWSRTYGSAETSESFFSMCLIDNQQLVAVGDTDFTINADEGAHPGNSENFMMRLTTSGEVIAQ